MGLPALAIGGGPSYFGPYTLLEQLGQGGMAVVYRAQRTGDSPGRDIVLKAMLPSLVKSAQLVEMFEGEARLTAQLRHPSIVRVEDFGVADGIPYLIMEFLDGRNLSQLRNALAKKKRTIPVPVAVAIARELCGALGYAHHFIGGGGRRMQVIHRDVSPSNVMVLRDGTVRLLDFGVAKLSSAAGQAVTTSLKGKFAYMAPEQVNQEPIDRRCDVFAAGIVLHEMLTGRRLFGASSELETLRRVSLAEVSPPSRLNAAVPPALDALVMRALSRLPADRYDSGAEMATALDELRLAATRRDLAALIGETFRSTRGPGDARATMQDDEGDTQGGPVEDSLEGVTAPEGPVGVPGSVSPRLALVPEPGTDPEMAFEDEAVPTGKSPKMTARATAIGKGLQKSSEPVSAPPAARTVAAPLDEVRPTRIYDAAPAAAKKNRAESDFEHRPTQVYDGDDGSDPLDLPHPPVASRPSDGLRAAGIRDLYPPAAEPRYAWPRDAQPLPSVAAPLPQPSAPVPRPGPGVPTAFHGFEALSPATLARPEPAQGGLRLILVGLLALLCLSVAALGGYAYFRHTDAPSLEPTAHPPTVTSEPIAHPSAVPSEPAHVAPAAAPARPPALPPALPAEEGVSLVGLDKKSDKSAKPERSEKTPKPERSDKSPKPERSDKSPRPERAEQGEPVERPSAAAGPKDEAPAERSPGKKVKAPKGSVKEGRIVDPFDTAE